MSKVDVYDIECLVNLFTYTGRDRASSSRVQFALWHDPKELKALYDHLSSLSGMIGFNNTGYDAQLIEYLLIFQKDFLELPIETVVSKLYAFSQLVISRDRFKGEKPPYYKFSIPQLDLFTIYHFNNPQKSQNLKGIGFHLNAPVVADLPYPHDYTIKTQEEVDEVLKYNDNDVITTADFLEKSYDKIELRKSLTKKYGIDFTNDPNSKIGEKLILELYCKKVGKAPTYIKKKRTYRRFVKGADIIFPYIRFTSKEFSNVLEEMKEEAFTHTKDGFSKTVLFNNVPYIFGSGGIHACNKAGIYSSNENYLIKDCDVASLYPSIAIRNKLYPEHLGMEFCEVYENDIVNVRLTEKAKGKKGDKAIVEGFKEAANIVFGKSNSQWSFLYDPKYALATTLNGQLLLCMLAERLSYEISSCEIIQVNTDGITLRLNRRDIPAYNNVCERWEKLTKFTLEFKDYEKFIVRDVNNYTAQEVGGTIKQKGIFEVDKEWHKDASFKIIPIALREYFFNNIPLKETIMNEKDIFKFCGWFRASHGWELSARNIYTRKARPLPRSNRYFASREGEFFQKENIEDGKEFFVDSCKGVLITFFNTYYKSDNYNINYDFYIEECEKIINAVIKKPFPIQHQMF